MIGKTIRLFVGVPVLLLAGGVLTLGYWIGWLAAFILEGKDSADQLWAE